MGPKLKYHIVLRGSLVYIHSTNLLWQKEPRKKPSIKAELLIYPSGSYPHLWSQALV